MVFLVMYKSTGFLAKEYSVTNETILNWIKEGKPGRVGNVFLLPTIP